MAWKLAVIGLVFGLACRAGRPEDRHGAAPVEGDTATAAHPFPAIGDAIYAATDMGDYGELSEQLRQGDRDALAGMERAGRAVRLPIDSRVLVMKTSGGLRLVKTPMGVAGWVQVGAIERAAD